MLDVCMNEVPTPGTEFNRRRLIFQFFEAEVDGLVRQSSSLFEAFYLSASKTLASTENGFAFT